MLDTKALVAAMAPIIKEAVAAAEGPLLRRIEALEKRAPEKGEPGEPGRDGQDGRDGRDAEPVSDEQIAAAVEAYMAANPAPAGRDGVDGTDGKDGAPGEKGLDGKDGADGVGLAGAIIGREGDLIVTLTNGEVKSLGPVVGRDGKDGERGADGQAWTAMDVTRTGPRTVELSFEHGDQRNTFEMEFPVPVYRGVFSEGEEYVEGDMVTFGGSLWHANEATSLKPGEGAKAWTLAAKRGRDGKDFAGPQVKAAAKVKI